DLTQVTGVAFLERAIGKTFRFRAPIAGLHEVARDVHAQHLRTAARCRQRRGAIAAAEVEHLETARDAESLDQRLAALTHALRDAGEVALLPEYLVRIHVNAPRQARGVYLIRWLVNKAHQVPSSCRQTIGSRSLPTTSRSRTEASASVPQRRFS